MAEQQYDEGEAAGDPRRKAGSRGNFTVIPKGEGYV